MEDNYNESNRDKYAYCSDQRNIFEHFLSKPFFSFITVLSAPEKINHSWVGLLSRMLFTRINVDFYSNKLSETL